MSRADQKSCAERSLYQARAAKVPATNSPLLRAVARAIAGVIPLVSGTSTVTSEPPERATPTEAHTPASRPRLIEKPARARITPSPIAPIDACTRVGTCLPRVTTFTTPVKAPVP
jgi:hypothetical protein